MPNTFYFYDLETSGRSANRHRILQFAGQRTDAQLRPIGAPLVLDAQLSLDTVPELTALLVTGIDPLRTAAGITEAELIGRIDAELSESDACTLGYNSLRFDDEFLRYAYYRSLRDPYAREWGDGRSRWDLIDLVRACHALRPDGLVWPKDDSEQTSLRLELLSAANGIEHTNAHDAMSDVSATIALARAIRAAQPKLFHFYFALRQRAAVDRLLRLTGPEPVLHVSGRLPRSTSYCALIAPLAMHPTNNKSMLVLNLADDPEALMDLSVAQLQERLFSRFSDLPEGVSRPGIKELRSNRCPFVAPMSALRRQDAERLGIDLDLARQRHQWVLAHPELGQRVAAAFAGRTFKEDSDVDGALYGSFASDSDRDKLEDLRTGAPASLLAPLPTFDNPNLAELVQRYVARNHPTSMTPALREQWRQLVAARWLTPDAEGVTAQEQFESQVEEVMADPERSPAHCDLACEWQGWLEEQLAECVSEQPA